MVSRSIACALVVAAAQLASVGPAAAQTTPAGACAGLGDAGAAILALTASNEAAGATAADALCGLLQDVSARAEAAEAQAAELRTALLVTQEQMPPRGSILMVDDGRGCPAGWTDVALAEPEVFAGRMPVATGFAEERTFRGFREIGGSEAVVLEEANLPPHAHTLPLAFVASRDRAEGSRAGSGFTGGGSFGNQQVATRSLSGRERTERAGGALPHDNMPPYVSLFWCRRD